MKTLFVRFVRNDEGQDLIEYAMLGTVIALTVYAGANTMATKLAGWYTALGTKVDGWATSLAG